MNFSLVLTDLDRYFQGEGIAFAIIGGFALHAYGRSRTTFDLDLVVPLDAQARLIEHLESIGFETLHSSTGYSNHLHPDTERGRLDFVYVSGTTASKLFGEARPLFPLGESRLLVPSPEHLIAMKVLAMKNDPSRTYQDLGDIQYLMALPDVNLEQVREYFATQGLLQRYDELRKSI